MRNYLIEQKEYGYRFMISGEMEYVVDDAGKEVKDEVFEMLCERAEQAYLKTGDIDFEMWQLCKAVYDMYVDGTLENASAWDILDKVIRY